MIINALILSACVGSLTTAAAESRPADALVYNCYEPISGGWRIRLTADASAPRADASKRMGVVSPDQPGGGNPRLHRRPLYPPADRDNVFTTEQLGQLERCGFRPLVLAYVEPRFLFDYHSAGGLLGHLHIGLIAADGTSKWLHNFSELDVSYVDGRMEYIARDPALTGTTVRLAAIPLADCPGLIVKVSIEGLPEPGRLVWSYGGASGFFTNWAMTAPQFSFDPKQCERNQVRWDQDAFTLTRGFDKSDSIMEQVFAVPRYLKDYRAVLQGGCSLGGRRGFGPPSAFSSSPGELVKSADWDGQREQANVVAVEEVPLTGNRASGFIVVGMGRAMRGSIGNPGRAWAAAMARNSGIAGRVVTHTPDPHLDAAMNMLAFATEGTWADTAVAHGAWSWRFAYLGWRGWYGMNVYGWADRIAKSIRNHVRLNRVGSGPDEGALGSLLEYRPGVYYNMNEVFLDQVRQYFEYTGDLELMRQIYPVLEGILTWEDRRLRPAADPLYESALNTWISDQHWYIRGQCTQASAYMLRAHSFLADLARRLNLDPKPHADQAAAIRTALQDKLWMRQAGVFAEYLDTRGHRMLHAEPELPTLYHSAEFGAADPLQVWQMLFWADTHLRTVSTPQGGRLYWSSNWFPNMGRSYTHSTYELACAEELNFALTQHLAGRADEAWAIERGCLATVFSGPTPGGLPCHMYVDGRQRANDEFADAISMWGRAIVEGLFGIVPRRADNLVELSPQLPESWPQASIRTPQFSYELKRDQSITVAWTSPVQTAVRLRLPVRATSVGPVRVDGQTVPHAVEAGVDLTWIIVTTPPAQHGTIEVSFEPRRTSPPAMTDVKHGERLSVGIEGAVVQDPQQCLQDASVKQNILAGKVVADPGSHVLFVSAGTAACPFLKPVRLNVLPTTPPMQRVWTPPQVPRHDLSRWTLVDLGGTYNASLTEVLKRVVDALKPPPPPASEVNTHYYMDHLKAPFVSPVPSDAAWRARIGEDGIGWTTDGIPFRSPRQGSNIGVVTRVAVFPASLEFPVGSAGRTLYLMLSGTTFAMQSHVVNLQLTLFYSDGTSRALALVNPFDIGDCWNQYRFHDTAANGFENLGGRHGPAGSSAVKDLTQPVGVDTEAHLLAIEMKPGAKLERVRIEAIAEDIIFGVMGATILK